MTEWTEPLVVVGAATVVVALLGLVYKHFADKKSKIIVIKSPDEKLFGEAKILLEEATKDENRAIISNFYGVKTHDNSLDDGTPSSLAIWHDAVKELEKSGYIEACGPSREQFLVTGKGYKLAGLVTGEAKKKGWWQFWK